MDAVVSTLLPNLANNLGSSNAQVRQLTSDLLDTIINNAEGRCLQYVVESLSNIVAHGNNNKVKPVIMEKLIRKLHTFSNHVLKSFFCTKLTLNLSSYFDEKKNSHRDLYLRNETDSRNQVHFTHLPQVIERPI